MKIGIDGNPLTTPFPCGTKSYAQNLLKNLAKIDKKNEYVIFATKKVEVPNQKNFKLVKLPNFFPILKKQLFIPYFVKKEKIDIFHNLEPYGSVFLNHPKIITTVHDLRLNTTYPFLSKYFLNRLYCELASKIIFRKTKEFITDSTTVKAELSKFLKNKADSKIKVIPISYDKKLTGFNDTGIKNGILCMGDFAIRKNISKVIEAYSTLPSKIKSKHPLKIVASTQRAGNGFLALANKYKIGKYAQVYTAISDAQLTQLYNHSLVFVYPSLYEGFGIPILEAFACGCPVITSNYGAMKEVAGDSAYLVNPRSNIGISRAMQKIVENPQLSENLKKKGLKRVKMFSWKKTARETLELYNEVYKK